MSSGLPVLFSSTGPIPTPPATLQADLISSVETMAPGYTAALPGSLIEDMSSTGVGLLVTIDQARVDAINNVTPYGSNPYVLAQQGAQFGLPIGQPTNASVSVVFNGTAGYVIPAGFLVGDGTNQYAIQDGGVIGSTGASNALFAVCTNSNTFAIPAGSVTTVVTSVPSGYTLTVTNPQAGLPAQALETTPDYRSRMLTAMQAWGVGVPAQLRTLLTAVPGVQSRLVSILQNGTGWEVICGGGDPNAVAYAMYQAIASPGLLVASATSTRNVYVTLYDAPNSYNLVYVNPPSQTVTVAVTWNTTLTNFTSGNSVNQAILTAVPAYINAIPVGQPINLMVMQEAIQQAVASVLDPANLTTLEFVVTINGSTVTPEAGTSIIASDPESYFSISASGVTSAQG